MQDRTGCYFSQKKATRDFRIASGTHIFKPKRQEKGRRIEAPKEGDQPNFSMK